MVHNFAKKVYGKVVILALKALPVILFAFLTMHTNSTASSVNGQPTPPDSIKKYRKF